MRIDEHTFKNVKKWLRYRRPKTVAKKFDLHESTVLNIRGSRNYSEYREMVKAEHPPVKFSLRDEVLELHRKLFDKSDGQYHYPSSAKIAIIHIHQNIQLQRMNLRNKV